MEEKYIYLRRTDEATQRHRESARETERGIEKEGLKGEMEMNHGYRGVPKNPRAISAHLHQSA